MRTTLSLDDDVLAAARALAEAEQRSLGEVISDLARKGLAPRRAAPKHRDGVPILRARPGARPMTLAEIDALRDEGPWLE